SPGRPSASQVRVKPPLVAAWRHEQRFYGFAGRVSGFASGVLSFASGVLSFASGTLPLHTGTLLLNSCGFTGGASSVGLHPLYWRAARQPASTRARYPSPSKSSSTSPGFLARIL